MITSTGNARVKQLVTWQKKRKARDEEGVYIVEGIRMYREAPRAQVREVYVSEQFYSRYGEELGLSAWGRQMEILSDHVFSNVSDTKTPQGILLVMEQRSCEICEMLDLDAQGRKPLLMVLDNLQDPGNLGTILRAGEAAGVTGVIMSHDCGYLQSQGDPFNDGIGLPNAVCVCRAFARNPGSTCRSRDSFLCGTSERKEQLRSGGLHKRDSIFNWK